MYTMFLTDGSHLTLTGGVLSEANEDYLLITRDVVVSATGGIAAMVKMNTDQGLPFRLPMDFVAGSGSSRP